MTTERPPIEDVAEDTIAGWSDDSLAEIIIDIGKEAEKLTRMAALARHELVQRMVERDATVLDTDHWKGKLTPGAPSHTYDDALMAEGLAKALTDEEMAKALVLPPPPPPRWDQRVLNEYAKRGGPTKKAIDAATVTTRGAPKLKLERKGDA